MTGHDLRLILNLLLQSKLGKPERERNVNLRQNPTEVQGLGVLREHGDVESQRFSPDPADIDANLELLLDAQGYCHVNIGAGHHRGGEVLEVPVKRPAKVRLRAEVLVALITSTKLFHGLHADIQDCPLWPAALP